jgi:translocation and assembly module TamB
MASDVQRSPARLRKALLVLAGALLIAFAAIAWLLGTASGARTAFAAAAALSDGTLEAGGIDGRFVGPLQVARLTLALPDSRLTLSDLHLDWRPQALLHKRLHLTSLHAGHLDLALVPEKKSGAATLPPDLALPFPLQADEASIDSGEIRSGAVNLLKLGTIAFALDFDGDRYLLRLQRAAVERGDVAARISGEATLAAIKPYRLQGSFTSAGKAGAIDADGKLVLAGSLEELTAELDANVERARVAGNILLRPFSARPLGRARLRAQALDLSRFDAKLPRSALDVSLSVAENGRGDMKLTNTGAGTWDDRRLPLDTLALSFEEDAGRWRIENIIARLGASGRSAGEIGGHGSVAGGALTLSLRTEALDLRRLDRRLRATRLAGSVELHHTAGRQEFTLALSEPVGRQRVALDAHAMLADNELAIDRLRVQAGSGSLDASARMALAGAQAFTASGDIRRFRLQELGEFPNMPELELNGGFSLSGVRQPRLETALTFTIDDSRLAGQMLTGEGDVQLREERLQVKRFLLAAGANRLHIEGLLAEGDAQLAFSLDAPQLAQLGPAFGGALQASGKVRGSLARPRIDALWNANRMRLPGGLQIEQMQGNAEIGIDRKRAFLLDRTVATVSARGMRLNGDSVRALSAQWRFGQQADAPLALNFAAEGIAGNLRAERLTATADGTTARHAIAVTLQETGQSWALKASGGLNGAEALARWQGSIDAFNADGRFQARLAAPAALLVAAQHTRLEHFIVDAANGRIAVNEFTREAKSIVTRGRIEHLSLSRLLQLAAPAVPVRTDLQFGGEWDVRIGEILAGTAALRREKGDLTVLGGAPVVLGLRSLSANASAQDGRLALRLQAEGQQLGTIDLNVLTATGRGEQRLAIAPDAPVSGNARLVMPTLAWLAPLVSPSIATGGSLHGEVSLGGSVARPRLAGRIAGEALALRMSELGIDLHNGVLDSEFQDQRLLIRSLAFEGAQGRVVLSGPIDLGDAASAQLVLRAERFALLNRADRRAVVSGESRLVWQDRHGKLSGAYTLDSGAIDLGRADKPELSDDVVIAGRERKTPATSFLTLDLALSLGEGMKLSGHGIDAVLGGQVRLTSEAGETPQAQGTLNVVKGTYTAYGVELEIEQGGLRFRGALTNPTIDVLAMRRRQEVEAGVSVRGSVLAPRVTLVSEPSVPDAEKLSWLVLGRGLSTASESDTSSLQSAASALLSEGAKAGVQSRIASAIGLDTFSVGTSSDALQERIVTVGKRISSKLSVSYRQGLDSAASVVGLRYVLTPKLSVEAETGTSSALSLFYSIAFD